MITEKIKVNDAGTATLFTYIIDSKISTNKYKKRPAVIICPGGSYLFTATKEGEPVATRFLSMDYHVFVLRYTTYFKRRILSSSDIPEVNEASHYPLQVRELMTSLKIIKEHAKEWSVDDQNIFVMGFSAGGHIVATLGERWDDPQLTDSVDHQLPADFFKPRGLILCYPMLTANILGNKGFKRDNEDMKAQILYIKRAIFGTDEVTREAADELDIVSQVRSDMPPVFLWHTYTDELTNAADSTELMLNLIKYKVPCEYHLYSTGKHGMALCDETSATSADDMNKACATWPMLANHWMRSFMHE